MQRPVLLLAHKSTLFMTRAHLSVISTNLVTNPKSLLEFSNKSSIVFIPSVSMSAKKKRAPAKDFVTVFSQHYGDLQEEFIDAHCHIDAILERFNAQEKNADKGVNAEAVDECCNGPKPSSSDATSQEKPLWTWERLHDTFYLGNQPASVTVCCDVESYDPIMSLLDNDKTGKLYGAFGIHPHEAKRWTPEVEARLVKAMKHPKIIAWGECGLDFHYNNSPRQIQIDCFIRQIQLAVQHQKPLVVHSREADQDTLDILQQHLPKDHKVHLHCCTSSANMIAPLLAAFPNLYVGFTGCITFGTADENRKTVASVPINRLLLETDGPYMAPVPFRGQIAHPGMIPFVAEVMAKVHNVDLVTLLRQVRENTRFIYGI